jgi:hypothetical protein
MKRGRGEPETASDAATEQGLQREDMPTLIYGCVGQTIPAIQAGMAA